MTRIGLVGCGQLVTLAGPDRPRVGDELGQVAAISDGALVWEDGHIVAAGPRVALESQLALCGEVHGANGRLVTPGLIDAHSHPIFVGERAEEFEMRTRGSSYQNIAAAGGGIRSTVRKVQGATEDLLLEESPRHLGWMLRCGTTTAEAKSGYGLTVEDELKMLRVIRRLDVGGPISLVPTLLGAHAIPDEFRNDREGYVRLVVEQMIPKAAAEGLAEFCDVFSEQGYFTPDCARAIAAAASQNGMEMRMHVDQLTDGGGAALAAEIGARTADHLEQTGPAGIAALARAGVQPVLLPASVYALGLTRYPDARAMIHAGLAVVLATDFNPGSSPTPSLTMAMSLACTQMKMTPAEALAACTVNAAWSLNRNDRGTLEPGRRADFVIWDASDYRELPYYFGFELASEVWTEGRIAFER